MPAFPDQHRRRDAIGGRLAEPFVDVVPHVAHYEETIGELRLQLRIHTCIGILRAPDAEYARDPVSASAEYGALFRTDIESFVSRELVKACVIPGRLALPPQPSVKYVASWDQAGGAGQDSATGAIASRSSMSGTKTSEASWPAPAACSMQP